MKRKREGAGVRASRTWRRCFKVRESMRWRRRYIDEHETLLDFAGQVAHVDLLPTRLPDRIKKPKSAKPRKAHGKASARAYLVKDWAGNEVGSDAISLTPEGEETPKFGCDSRHGSAPRIGCWRSVKYERASEWCLPCATPHSILVK